MEADGGKFPMTEELVQRKLAAIVAADVVGLDPRHSDAFVTLCSDYVLAGRDDEARRTARRIVEIDPEFRIFSYANKLPYRDATKVTAIVETLRSAGLPE